MCNTTRVRALVTLPEVTDTVAGHEDRATGWCPPATRTPTPSAMPSPRRRAIRCSLTRRLASCQRRAGGRSCGPSTTTRGPHPRPRPAVLAGAAAQPGRRDRRQRHLAQHPPRTRPGTWSPSPPPTAASRSAPRPPPASRPSCKPLPGRTTEVPRFHHRGRDHLLTPGPVVTRHDQATATSAQRLAAHLAAPSAHRSASAANPRCRSA
jgi:hypothetical protein